MYLDPREVTGSGPMMSHASFSNGALAMIVPNVLLSWEVAGFAAGTEGILEHNSLCRLHTQASKPALSASPWYV